MQQLLMWHINYQNVPIAETAIDNQVDANVWTDSQAQLVNVSVVQIVAARKVVVCRCMIMLIRLGTIILFYEIILFYPFVFLYVQE